ncbi:NAD-dependent epimerase/dehydratase family protein [Pseudohoeflea coraliihabitans]|uniref:NAD(P)-dependent oxidoreductase n=1 Tax=Pseudohoeflea coraliihabitans TaxID=2860393 RepID=A0ABS6WNF1_9HYPH|nr:NAD(P)-dependent oxidoreductase [Pseudohoeflea sp. DP4N28-3]MBW3097188.1 NAD(P)-dependent oxidoreductase [Pseudohoeflea sp. DP4N28-3]
MSGAPVLVTGASGFIGRQVVKKLEKAGQPLRLLDVQFEREHPRHDIYEGSIADPKLVQRAVDGVGGIIHLAHLIDIDGERPFESVSVNIVGTANVFQSAMETGCRRVVWGSSVMTYAPDRSGGPVSEEHQQAPETFYGAGKLYLEKMARSYRSLGLETVGLRLTTVFGPERDRGGAASFVVDLFRKPVAGEPVSVAEGDRRVDMVYGPDAAAACVLALQSPRKLNAFYNVGGFSTRVRDLANEVRRILPDACIGVADGGINPWPESVDCSRSRKDFGYIAQYDLKTSVSHYLSCLTRK